MSDSFAPHPSCTEEGSKNLERPAIPVLVAFSLALYIVTNGYDSFGDDLILIGGNPYVKSYSVVAAALVAARGPPHEGFGPQGGQPSRGGGTPTTRLRNPIFLHLWRLFRRLTDGAALRAGVTC
jgi:hypothetical protein